MLSSDDDFAAGRITVHQLVRGHEVVEGERTADAETVSETVDSARSNRVFFMVLGDGFFHFE